MLGYDNLILTTLGPKPAGSITEPTPVFSVDVNTNAPMVEWYYPGRTTYSRGVEVTFDSDLVLVASDWQKWIDIFGRRRDCLFLARGDRVCAFSINLRDDGMSRIRRNGRNGYQRNIFVRPYRLVAEFYGADVENKMVVCLNNDYTDFRPENLMVIDDSSCHLYDKDNGWTPRPWALERERNWHEKLAKASPRERKRLLEKEGHKLVIRPDLELTDDFNIKPKDENHWVWEARAIPGARMCEGYTKSGTVVIADPEPYNRKSLWSGIVVGTNEKDAAISI